MKEVGNKIAKQGGLAPKNELASVENKTPDAYSLVKKTDLNAKNAEIKNKIPNITGLVTNSALTAVENKILDVSSLVTKADYNRKISEIEKEISYHNHDQYITAPEFNNLAAGIFNARLTQANLVKKTDFGTKLQNLI